MSLASTLATRAGIYTGTGDGPESGPFESRIEVTLLPNGGVAIDYEATSRSQGLLHREHSMLVAGPDQRDRLFIAHSESPFVTTMVAVEPDGIRFVQPEPFGPYVMEVEIDSPEPDRITYAWRWAEPGQEPIEQSKAEATRSR